MKFNKIYQSAIAIITQSVRRVTEIIDTDKSPDYDIPRERNYYS